MDKTKESKITSLAIQWCEENPVPVYAERHDFDGIEDFVSGCDSLTDFEDKAYEAYSDAAENAISYAVPEAQRWVAQALGKPTLDEEEAELVRSEVWCDATIEYPFDEWLRQQVRVDLIFKGDAQEPHELGYDSKALANLLSLCQEQGVPPTEEARASIDREVAEAKESGSNVLCVLATITLKEYFELLEHPLGYSVELTPQHYIGFYDPWAGGGSAMAIDLPGKVLVPAEMLTQVLLENSTGSSKGFVTADHVYGFVSRAFVETRVFDIDE